MSGLAGYIKTLVYVCRLLYSTSLSPLVPRLLPGGGGAAGAGVLGALLPGNAGGGGPGLVHPSARPQQPGRWAAAAAAQRSVGQRSPQQPGGSGGESEAHHHTIHQQSFRVSL